MKIYRQVSCFLRLNSYGDMPETSVKRIFLHDFDKL